MSTAVRAAALLNLAADTMRDRDAEYASSDTRTAAILAAMFPEGIELKSVKDFHRYHFVVMIAIKMGRYAANWPNGHEDSLIDLATYSAMLLASDQARR